MNLISWLFPSRRSQNEREQWYRARIAWNNKKEFYELARRISPSNSDTKGNLFSWQLINDISLGIPKSLQSIQLRKIGFEYAYYCTGMTTDHQILFCKGKHLELPMAKLIQLHFINQQLLCIEMRLSDGWSLQTHKLWGISLTGLNEHNGLMDEHGNCIFVNEKLNPSLVLVTNSKLLTELCR
jgi:hypothetical protein